MYLRGRVVHFGNRMCDMMTDDSSIVQYDSTEVLPSQSLPFTASSAVGMISVGLDVLAPSQTSPYPVANWLQYHNSPALGLCCASPFLATAVEYACAMSA